MLLCKMSFVCCHCANDAIFPTPPYHHQQPSAFIRNHQQPPTIPTNETLLVQAEQSNTSSVRHSTQIVYPLSAIVHDVLWLFSRAMMNLDGDTINNYLSCGKCYERKWHPNGRLGRLGCRKDVRNVILNDIRYSF